MTNEIAPDALKRAVERADALAAEPAVPEVSYLGYPLEDRVLILKDTAAEKSKGGILLQEAARDVPCTGTVIAVGPGRCLEMGKLLVPNLKENDRVLFNDYAVNDVPIRLCGIPKGREVAQMREADVIMRIEEAPASS